MQPLNGVAFLILGLAVLWSVRLIYGARGGASDDLLKRLLLLAGWILIVVSMVCIAGALAGMLVLPFSLLMGFLFFAYLRYQRSERQVLFWTLATAAEHGIPLDQAARAFADERAVQVGARVTKLADLLQAGVPLPVAFRMSRNTLPMDADLAVNLATETGAVGSALQMSLSHVQSFDDILRKTLTKFAYFAFILSTIGVILSFVMLKIVPVWTRMFDEFDLELPRSTELLIEVSEAVNPVYFLFLFCLLAICLAMFVLALPLRYSRYWLQIEPRMYTWFWMRHDSALVLRALAVCVRQSQDMATALDMLSLHFPTLNVARRLQRASRSVQQGRHWCDTLRSEGILRKVDVAVLKSAERVGNLPWALEEMADSGLRRFVYRLQAWLNLTTPPILFALGVLVAFIVISLFLPLISMIQGLA